MDKRDGLILGLAAMVCVSGLSGCASERRQHDDEADLASISRWLPGTYNNAQQVKSDLAKGIKPVHDAVELNVVVIDSIAVGRSAFYLQESAADDPMRVFSQRVITFSVTPKGIIQTVNILIDPLRWRNGQREPDMFESITPRDFKAATGCEITWKREEGDSDKDKKLSKEDALRAAEHRKFVGTNDSKHCRVAIRPGRRPHSGCHRRHVLPLPPLRPVIRHGAPPYRAGAPVHTSSICHACCITT
jgi:hypothetical protein